MKERPILFNGPMIQAILEGRKTQTRRIVKWPKWIDTDYDKKRCSEIINSNDYRSVVRRGCCDGVIGKFGSPYGIPGDRLWVRETCWYAGYAGGIALTNGTDTWRPNNFLPAEIWGSFRDKYSTKKCPSIFMPRWASRITLEITGVSIERLKDISAMDALSEGVGLDEEYDFDGYGIVSGIHSRLLFAELWNSINEKRGYSWCTNPWVWVVEFRVI